MVATSAYRALETETTVRYPHRVSPSGIRAGLAGDLLMGVASVFTHHRALKSSGSRRLRTDRGTDRRTDASNFYIMTHVTSFCFTGLHFFQRSICNFCFVCNIQQSFHFTFLSLLRGTNLPSVL